MPGTRAVRWGVPIATVAVVGAAAGAGPVLAAVRGEPALPARTAQQLLAEAARAADRTEPPVMSGTVVETAALGLPSLPLPSSGGGSSPLSLLSGSNTLKVWYGGNGKARLALPGPLSETDLITDGSGAAWLWESDKNTATRITMPRGTGPGARPQGTALPGATTPDALAAQVLKAAEAGTTVGVSDNERIAGRAAYQLTLTPKDTASLVDRVTVALDGRTYLPLRVQVFARGGAEPAFEVGFTQVTFSPPAAENFAFTPPAGATVTEKKLDDVRPGTPEKLADHAGRLRTFGEGWSTVAEMPFSTADLSALAGGKDGGKDGAKEEDGPAGDRAGGPAELAGALLSSAQRVSGPWGGGRLVTTKLVSALLTDDGRLLVGAVTPQRLTEVAGRG
ncbi:hypothetical protein Sru01_21880 [Sphaerisporangium rufum]|uniref:DUF2092 domain-containing protein n=1 Tax=Sphaerisporangium rufum TaxID=1381558 RepID=A0A919R2I4_9ACTN|nr:DUF2092 domain-containing protein [Sphaerisporangium rufum]GII77206.1 hypothetical protein Sru01_21880 [Sphaerisporangium rufum]